MKKLILSISTLLFAVFAIGSANAAMMPLNPENTIVTYFKLDRSILPYNTWVQLRLPNGKQSKIFCATPGMEIKTPINSKLLRMGGDTTILVYTCATNKGNCTQFAKSSIPSQLKGMSAVATRDMQPQQIPVQKVGDIVPYKVENCPATLTPIWYH